MPMLNLAFYQSRHHFINAGREDHLHAAIQHFQQNGYVSGIGVLRDTTDASSKSPGPSYIASWSRGPDGGPFRPQLYRTQHYLAQSVCGTHRSPAIMLRSGDLSVLRPCPDIIAHKDDQNSGISDQVRQLISHRGGKLTQPLHQRSLLSVHW